MKHYLQFSDLDAAEYAYLFERAAEIKRQRWLEVPGWLLMTCLRNDDAQREREAGGRKV